jgi:hypothetical protein
MRRPSNMPLEGFFHGDIHAHPPQQRTVADALPQLILLR